MGNDEKQSGSVSFGEALVEVVKNLKDQPPLLFAIAIAILMLGAGTLAFENLRVIVGSLLILTVVGLSGWLFFEAQKRRHESDRLHLQHEHERASAPTATGGSVDIDNVSSMTDNVITGGPASVAGSGIAKGGEVKISGGTGTTRMRGNIISGGNAEVNVPESGTKD